MNNIRLFFCMVLTVLLVILLGWSYYQNSTISDLKDQYKELQIDLKDTQKTNSLLRQEVERINEIANEHHNLTSQTEENYKEIVDEIRKVEESYNDWFNAECPVELNGVLSKSCNKNKVQGDSVRTTEVSPK